MEHLWDKFGSNWWFYVQTAMTIGMLVHAYRSGAQQFWYFVVLFFQPIGAWIYFFAVFLRGVRFSGGFTWERKHSLEELQYRAERAPTVHNRTALAERLMEKGRHSEAIPLLEAVLAMDDIYLPAEARSRCLPARARPAAGSRRALEAPARARRALVELSRLAHSHRRFPCVQATGGSAEGVP